MLHRGRLRRGAVSLCAGLKCRACKAVLVGRHLQAAQLSASVQLNTAGCSCQLAWVVQAALALEQTVHSRQKVARYCLQDHLSLMHNVEVSGCMLEIADMRGIWQQKAQTLCCSNPHSQCGAELSVRVLPLLVSLNPYDAFHDMPVAPEFVVTLARTVRCRTTSRLRESVL